MAGAHDPQLEKPTGWGPRNPGLGPAAQGSVEPRAGPQEPWQSAPSRPASAAGGTSPFRRGRDAGPRARDGADPGRSGPRARIRGRRTRAGFVQRAGGRTASPPRPSRPGPGRCPRIPAAAGSWQRGSAGGGLSTGPWRSPSLRDRSCAVQRGASTSEGAKWSTESRQRSLHELALRASQRQGQQGPPGASSPHEGPGPNGLPRGSWGC